MLILPLVLAVPRTDDWRRVQPGGKQASSQIQSNISPSYIVLTLEAGPDILLSESLFEVSSYPQPGLIVGLPSLSACAWLAMAGFPS